MPSAPHNHRPLALWLRVLAVVCAALVFALSSAARSPALHAWLHGENTDRAHTACASSHTDEPAHGEATGEKPPHHCAVTYFAAGGLLLAIPLIVVGPPETHPPAPGAVARDFLAPPPSRHLRPVSHAPPEPR